MSSVMDFTPDGSVLGIDGRLKRYLESSGMESSTVPPSDAAMELISAFLEVSTMTVIAAEASMLNATSINTSKIRNNRLADITFLLLLEGLRN